MVAWGRSQAGKRYAGPVIGEPDSYRWGDPGWDCSSFVAGAYKQIGVAITAYTDAAFDQTHDADTPLPGDVVFYQYYDAGQPAVSYPHMGIWLGPHRTLECRYPDGVAEYHQLVYPMYIRRANGL